LRDVLGRLPDEWRPKRRAFAQFSSPFQHSSKYRYEIAADLRNENWHWFPRAEGDDYEMQQQIRAGKTFGTVPFDELWMLGLERDNDLPMRAHIGTHDGRKGSAPLGRNYFLSNWEADKNLYGNGIVTLKIGPFLDVGKVTAPLVTLGPNKWLWDTGAQLKLRVFGAGVAFSYGKDLRSGNNAFYLTTLR
jgi:hypothetical protein